MSTNKHIVSAGERLKALHARSQLNWKHLAKLLEISLSMLHQVNRGHRNLSAKALHRLEDLEKKIAETEQARSGIDGHIRMRLECLQSIIDNCTDAELKEAFNRFVLLAEKDKSIGKIFDQVSEVISANLLRRMMKNSTPKLKGKK